MSIVCVRWKDFVIINLVFFIFIKKRVRKFKKLFGMKVMVVGKIGNRLEGNRGVVELYFGYLLLGYCRLRG